MTHKEEPEKRKLQPSDGEADRMNWPMPRSGDRPTPQPVATGLAAPADAAAKASDTLEEDETVAQQEPRDDSER
jgi:hypothetical protein